MLCDIRSGPLSSARAPRHRYHRLSAALVPAASCLLVLPVQSMGDVLSALSAAVGAADKVVELIHREPATPAPGTYTPDTFAGRLQLSDVHFRYPARPDASVLNGLSLQVNPGEVSRHLSVIAARH